MKSDNLGSWKRLFLAFATALILMIAFNDTGTAQIIASNNNCEENEGLLSVYTGTKKEGTKIIFVARQGRHERTSTYAARRLKVLKNKAHGLDENEVVFAFGPGSAGRPQVEVYLNGRLELIFETRAKGSLLVGNCQN